MKITIDTKEDSHEDIKKMVVLLSEIIAHKENKNIFSNASPEMPNIFGMFDQQPINQTDLTITAQSASSSLVGSAVKKDLPQVELY